MGFRILNGGLWRICRSQLCRKRAIELKANHHREGELKLGWWN
ncbi:hypothetical protein [Tychonema sp. BBK16]